MIMVNYVSVFACLSDLSACLPACLCVGFCPYGVYDHQCVCMYDCVCVYKASGWTNKRNNKI